MAKPLPRLVMRVLLSPLPSRLLILLALLILQAAIFILCAVSTLLAAGFSTALIYGIATTGIITAFFMLTAGIGIHGLISKAIREGRSILGLAGLPRTVQQIKITQQQPFSLFLLLTIVAVTISMVNIYYLFQMISLHALSAILPLLALEQVIIGSAGALILLLFSATLACGVYDTLSVMTANLLNEPALKREIHLREKYSQKHPHTFAPPASTPGAAPSGSRNRAVS